MRGGLLIMKGDGKGMLDERNMNGTRARKRPKEL